MKSIDEILSSTTPAKMKISSAACFVLSALFAGIVLSGCLFLCDRLMKVMFFKENAGLMVAVAIFSLFLTAFAGAVMDFFLRNRFDVYEL